LQDEDSSDNPDRSNFRTPRISAFDDEEDDQGIDYDVAEDPGNPEEEFVCPFFLTQASRYSMKHFTEHRFE
jgi:hypothetical protein